MARSKNSGLSVPRAALATAVEEHRATDPLVAEASAPLPADLALESMSVVELFALSSAVTVELKRRGHVRTSTSTGGELMERAVADAYGGTLAPPGTKSWDVALEDGRYAQVKVRVLPHDDMRHWAFKDFDFDLAVVIHIDRVSLQVLWARDLSRAEAQALARQHASGGWRMQMTRARNAGIDVTERIRAAYAALS